MNYSIIKVMIIQNVFKMYSNTVQSSKCFNIRANKGNMLS